MYADSDETINKPPEIDEGGRECGCVACYHHSRLILEPNSELEAGGFHGSRVPHLGLTQEAESVEVMLVLHADGDFEFTEVRECVWRNVQHGHAFERSQAHF